jgi:hypothetical protein
MATILNFEGILDEFYKMKSVHKQPFLPTTKTTTKIIIIIIIIKAKVLM